MKQTKLRILMLGWEYAPYNTGGLGVVCKELSEAFARKGHEITFISPKNIKTNDFITIKVAQKGKDEVIDRHNIDSWIIPYLDSEKLLSKYSEQQSLNDIKKMYSVNFFTEMVAYIKKSMEIADESEFDIVYAHDWMTYKAGQMISAKHKKPFIVHSHSLEWERTANRPNDKVENAENYGLLMSDAIIAISEYEKKVIMQRCKGIFEHKVVVAYNSSDYEPIGDKTEILNFNEITGIQYTLDENRRYVTFVGRLAAQKGLVYLIDGFYKVFKTEGYEDVDLIICGMGNMDSDLKERVINLGMEDRVHFLGFRNEGDLTTVYRRSDVLVVSSFSEPFGLIALEATKMGVPVIMTESTGAKEVLKHCPTYDYHDIDALSKHIKKVLDDPQYAQKLVEKSKKDMEVVSWDKSADIILEWIKRVIINFHA